MGWKLDIKSGKGNLTKMFERWLSVNNGIHTINKNIDFFSSEKKCYNPNFWPMTNV
jgi:hypothetical protein